MYELEVLSTFMKPINGKIAPGELPWAGDHVFPRADDEEFFPVLTGKRGYRRADGGLVAFKVDRSEDSEFFANRVNNAYAGCPLP